MIKTITFDLDDTLWPLRPTLDHAENHTYDWLKQHAPALTAAYTLEDLCQQRIELMNQRPDLRHQISQVRTETIYRALLQAGYSSNEAETLEQQALNVFLEARHKVSPFEHSEHLLQTLKPSYRLGVLTNGNADIYKLPLGKYFDFAFRAEQLDASKPSPEPFIAAMKSANCEAKEIVHIGDSIKHDVIGALNAGYHAVWFNPNNEEKPKEISKSYEINCLSELPEVIKKITSV